MSENANKEIKRLRAALRKYGQHSRTCDITLWCFHGKKQGWKNFLPINGVPAWQLSRQDRPQCTCGFDNARAT